MSVRLVLADDHPLMLDGLEALFRSAGDFEVVARCRDGAEALHARRGRAPVVILTATVNDEEVVEALRLGVRGVTPRTLGMSELTGVRSGV